MDLRNWIKDVPDFPTEGILFKDITPLLQSPEAFGEAIKQMSDYAKAANANVIVGPESRGFIFGTPVACSLGNGFVPVRKAGKLPRKTISKKYDLEYGSNELFMHEDAIKPGDKIMIIDDLLATGGTVKAAISMIEQLGGEVVGCCFLIELEALEGRKVLEGYPIHSLITY